MKLFLFLMLISFSLYAGNELGNGGNTVREPCGNKWYFYDVYEMELLFNWSVVLPEETRKEVDIAKGFLERLRVIDSDLSDELQNYAEKFYTFVIFNYNIMYPLEDYDTVYLEEGSRFYQLIKQRQAITCGFECSRYEITEPLWRNLDKVQKAAAIVHEVLYKVALINHPKLKRSDDIKFLNQLILADKVEELRQSVQYLYELYYKKDPVGNPVLTRMNVQPVRSILPPRCSVKE